MQLGGVIQRDIRVFAGVTAGCALAFIIALWLFFLPMVRAHLMLSSKLKAGKASFEKSNSAIKDQSMIEGEVKKYTQMLKGKKEKLFWEKGIGGFLDEITRMASDMPIEFVSITPQAPLLLDKKDEDKKAVLALYREVPISVEFKGDYANLVKFITKIESSDKFITVKKIDIFSGTQKIFQHTVRLTLTIFSTTG